MGAHVDGHVALAQEGLVDLLDDDLVITRARLTGRIGRAKERCGWL
jgi:hypothetical protein